MDKVPLLLFSGGLDSTYMLQEALRDGDVETLYVSASQHPDKIKKELEHREKLFAKLRRIYPNARVRRDRVVTLGNTMDGAMPDHKFIQPALWLHAALTLIDGEDRHTELRIGYVNGDSNLSHLHDIRAAWDALNKFTKWHPVPVNFPLEFVKKKTVLRGIHPQLYKDIWVCETPKAHGKHIRACQQCEPCLTHAAALFVYERMEGQSLKEHHARIMPSYRLPPLPRKGKVEIDLAQSTPFALTLDKDVKIHPPRKKHGTSKNDSNVVRNDKLRTRGIGRPDFGRG